MYQYFPYKQMGHKQILLYGFHFSFIIIFSLAVIRDLMFGNMFNASINATGVLTTSISYYLLHFKHKERLASYLIIFVAIIPLYILIYFNHFGNMVIVYVILIPLAVFLLLRFKEALIFNLFIFLLLIVMLYYISIVQPDAPILNNPKALINITFVSMLTMFFGIFYHLAIESHMKKLIHSNKQKDILLQEVHHRVKNNLNLTGAMLGLQALNTNDEVKMHLMKSKTRIESIAAVHEMLYQQESFDQIHFYDYIIKLEGLLSKAYSGKEKYTLRINVDRDLTFPLNMMVQFGLMLNEMLANTLKYAKNSEDLVITISLQKKMDQFIFTYHDNGINPKSKEELEKHSGLGSKLIRLSAKQIEGELSIYFKEGLTYRLEIKDG